MPIDLNVFNSLVKNESERKYTEQVTDFLKKHRDKAYTLDELSIELKTGYQKIRAGLLILKRKSLVNFRRVGMTLYYTYKEPIKTDEKKI